MRGQHRLPSLILIFLALGAGYSGIRTIRGQTTGAVAVTAALETEPVPHNGDAADDPAIWVHPTDPSLSTILGTDKKGGLAVYDLAGKQLQFVTDGKPNNVDLRYNFPLGEQPISLVTAGNRSNNSLTIYRVDPATRRLENVTAGTITTLQVYGSCMYHSRQSNRFYYFVNSPAGDVEQWEVFDTGADMVGSKRVRTFSVGSQTEGCVADDELGYLFIGEEAVGIWKYGAEPDAGTARTLVDSTDANGHLTTNVEGLTIRIGANGSGYLLASSQGSNSFVVYNRAAPHQYITTISITAGEHTDGVSGTDGIDVTGAPLGTLFPTGVFVAQDNDNNDENQNFKLVAWETIAAVSPLLSAEPGPQPYQAQQSDATPKSVSPCAESAAK